MSVQPYILLVEDEEALATLVHYNLEKENCRVELCADGEEAMIRIDEKLPDLIILDWMLPSVSGIEVCRRLRQRSITRNLPIIMLTARGEETDRVRGLDTGADDYIVKPFLMSELSARVRAVLRRIRPGLAEDRIRQGDIVIDRYNAQTTFEIERIRDFLILHYRATERNDSDFWNYCRTMSIPESLENNIRLFRDSGRFFRDAEEMFAVTSWVQVMLGQHINPRKYHPLVDHLSDAELRQFISGVEKVITSCVEVMPPHEAFIARHCAAGKI